ncbi:hypothetical protein [Robbsia andropogonis]|uniref:hypothetical protein n=1 Tax=Robbsia andropogonis TaxID=28092 RepID=UPI002A69A185|nr:hypothetical protein [Robbsia andropogonis]
MRLSDTLANAVEGVKQRWQESSSSEVARRLLELGVAADARTASIKRALPEEPREALIVLRDRYYRDDVLTWDEWAFLGRMTHQAYMFPDRSFVNGNLLRKVLLATRALLAARTQHIGKSTLPSDAYYRSKLDLREGEQILEGIDRVASSLSEWSDAGYAEWLTRPIEGYFNGEDPVLPDALINDALKPYLDTLLTLSIRALWKAEGKALEERRDERDRGTVNMRHLGTINAEGLNLSLTVNDGRLSAILDFSDLFPMLLSLSSLPLINDFFDLLVVATRPGARHHAYEAGGRRLSLPFGQYGKFILWDGDKNFHLPDDAMRRLAALVDASRSDPGFVAYEKAGRLTYGAI